ncbi:MAG: sulfite exporter TauE/SafE family protein, partial [Rhizobacter sp.]|nr:sulfite exporter TauE/SafE family protein [Rhizobacter sp.]
MLISLALGVFVGAVLGLTGAGGGILAVPALVVGLGWSLQQAAPVALIAVAGGAAVGAAEGFRRKLVRYKAALLMTVGGMSVTSLGIRMAHALPQRALLALFAAVMLLVARRLFLQTRNAANGPVDDALRMGQIDPSSGRFVWSWRTAALLGFIGALTGFMTGLLGVGGGFVIVPMLRRFTNMSMHAIVATSLMVIALVGFGGVVA